MGMQTVEKRMRGKKKSRPAGAWGVLGGKKMAGEKKSHRFRTRESRNECPSGKIEGGGLLGEEVLRPKKW